jgi:hypothetical protein
MFNIILGEDLRLGINFVGTLVDILQAGVWDEGKRLREKANSDRQSAKSGPQGLKPALILLPLCQG